MKGKQVVEILSKKIGRPVEGAVVRQMLGGQMVGHRVTPEELVDVKHVFDVVALVPVHPSLIHREG